MRSILRPLAIAAALAFSGGSALADDHQTEQLHQTGTVDPFKDINLNERERGVNQAYIEKKVFFVLDVSGSMTAEERNFTRDGIISSLDNDNVNAYLGSGNYYEFNFVSFASLARIDDYRVVGSVADAKQYVREFFNGEDGETPRQFSNGANTDLSTAFNVIRQSLEAGGSYGEADVVVFSDAQIGDEDFVPDAKDRLIATSPKVQIHCGLQVAQQHWFHSKATMISSAERDIPTDWGTTMTIQQGTCNNRTFSYAEDYIPGQEYEPAISAALHYTMS